MDGFDLWCERIKQLPDYAIEDTVAAICEIGFPAGKSKITIDFLRSRRDGIDVLVRNNIGQFPKLPELSPVAIAAAVGSLAAGHAPPTANVSS